MTLDIQGVLHLTDTAANQGAFTCLPGFSAASRAAYATCRLAPIRAQDLHALGAVPIAGATGDLIILYAALPHGRSPNSASLPQIVQYITLSPTTFAYNGRWR